MPAGLLQSSCTMWQNMLADFLLNLFDAGEVIFRSAPESPTDDPGEAVKALRTAFAIYRLDVAGPLIEFDAESALPAAEFARWVCWLLLHRDSPEEEVQKRVVIPRRPESASEHLSADLVFRYLPQLYRRARTLSPEDVLTKRLAEVLRIFPLSGVLADLDEPPISPLQFAGHEGLQLLYAERFVRHPRDAWRPEGRIAELIDLLKR
jgi:MoxR-vWA-beta-propeller ternary system protein